MTKPKTSSPFYKGFAFQRWDAGRRGISFELTFEQWLGIWKASGHLHERGCSKGQYVMARFGDNGPYAIGNVEIITCEANHRDYHKNNPGKQSAVMKARMADPVAKAELRHSLVVARWTPEQRARMSAFTKERHRLAGGSHF